MKRLELVLLLLVLALGTVPVAEAKKAAAPAAGISAEGRINVGLAQNYLQNHDLESALDRANRALRTDPDSGDVRAMLAMVYSAIGDHDKAAEQFQQALRLAPGNGPILNAYGAWQCQRGQFDEARATFEKALQDPFYKTPEQALYNAGKCAYDAGRAAEAEPLLRRALEKSGGDASEQANLLLVMAKVEFRLGKLLEARAFVQRRDALGSNPEVLDLAARIETAAGDLRAAGQYRQRLKDEFPDYVLSTGEGTNR